MIAYMILTEDFWIVGMLLTCPIPMCTHSQWSRNVILWLGESISKGFRSKIALWDSVIMPYSILQYHSHYSLHRSGWCTECWTYHYDYRTECCWTAGRRCGLYSSYRLVPVSLKGNIVTIIDIQEPQCLWLQFWIFHQKEQTAVWSGQGSLSIRKLQGFFS